MSPDWIGGIIGGVVIGLLGGVIGTWLSTKNTNGPRKRAFMVKAGVVCWLAIIVYLTLMFALPNPYRHFVWIVPFAAFIWIILHFDKAWRPLILAIAAIGTSLLAIALTR